MKSITIHGLDEALSNLICEKAKNQGTSLNKTIKKLLEESLGIRPKNENDHRNDFIDLFGSWSESEVIEFNNSIKDFRKIDPEDWA